MTFEVQQTRWDRMIRRVSGSIGPGSRVSETLSELFPVIDVERVPGELLLLGGTVIGWGGTIFGGGAGNSSRIQLFNPADSGTLVTVTQFIAAVSGTQTIRWSTVITELTNGIGVNTGRDTRLGITNLTVAQLRTQASAALTDADMQTRLLGNDPFTLKDENGVAVLAPGTGLEVGSGLLNTTLTVSFMWRERPAQPSELQF